MTKQWAGQIVMAKNLKRGTAVNQKLQNDKQTHTSVLQLQQFLLLFRIESKTT